MIFSHSLLIKIKIFYRSPFFLTFISFSTANAVTNSNPLSPFFFSYRNRPCAHIMKIPIRIVGQAQQDWVDCPGPSSRPSINRLEKDLRPFNHLMPLSIFVIVITALLGHYIFPRNPHDDATVRTMEGLTVPILSESIVFFVWKDSCKVSYENSVT